MSDTTKSKCWWASCSIEERPAGPHECEGCPALVTYEVDEEKGGES